MFRFIYLAILTSILSQHVFANVAQERAIHCGKTIICNTRHECTMLDGDYGFFKQGSSGMQDRYSLDRVTVAIGPAKDIMTCIYMAQNQMAIFVYKTSETDPKLTVIVDKDPNSSNYGWDHENNLSYKYTCNAKEHDCPVYH